MTSPRWGQSRRGWGRDGRRAVSAPPRRVERAPSATKAPESGLWVCIQGERSKADTIDK